MTIRMYLFTPTLEACKAVWEAGADIIALDCTSQINAEGRPAYELLEIVKKEIPEAPIFADVSNIEEARRAAEMGADIVAPTLYGYTEETKHIEEPDMRAFAQMCRELGDKVSIMMEGHTTHRRCNEMYVPRSRRSCCRKCDHKTSFYYKTFYRPFNRISEQLA